MIRITGTLCGGQETLLYYLVGFFLLREIFQTNFVQKIKTHFMFKNISQNRAVCVIVWNNSLQPDRSQIAMWCGACAVMYDVLWPLTNIISNLVARINNTKAEVKEMGRRVTNWTIYRENRARRLSDIAYIDITFFRTGCLMNMNQF